MYNESLNKFLLYVAIIVVCARAKMLRHLNIHIAIITIKYSAAFVDYEGWCQRMCASS